MWAVYKKELRSLFYSPIGYVAIGIFLLIFSGIFYFFSVSNRSIDLGTIYFAVALYGLPIIIAMLSMKSFAGEKSHDTEQLLFVSPKRTFLLILGKVFSIVSVIGIALIISIIYFLILSAYGSPDFGRVFIAWIGFILLSMAYISFGVLISSVTGNQIISAIITLVFLMIPLFFSTNNEILSYVFLIDYYQKFASGVISLREIICLLSFSIMCVTITTIGIDKQRN